MRVIQRFTVVILLLIFLTVSAVPAFAITPDYTPVSNELTADFRVIRNTGGGGGGGGGSVNVPPVAGPPECPFTDITGHWAENEIAEAYIEGFAKGISPTAFAPDRTITRAEFTALLVRALGLENGSYDSGYQDVEPGKWYFEAISSAANAGIVQGYNSSRFGPDDFITREQMAVMVVRALHYKGKGSPPTAEQVTELLAAFKDRDEISIWAGASISEALETGLIKGQPDGFFAPGALATRAEAAVIIWRLNNLLQLG